PGNPRTGSACAGAADPPRARRPSPTPGRAACRWRLRQAEAFRPRTERTSCLSTWEPSEGSHTLPRRSRRAKLVGFTTRLQAHSRLPLNGSPAFGTLSTGTDVVDLDTGYLGHCSQPVHPRKIVGGGTAVRVRVHRQHRQPRR